MTEKPTTTAATVEPDVPVPFPMRGGTPPCPVSWCGYRCGCCCPHSCQTDCPTPDSEGDCCCTEPCHGGHEPWDCHNFSTRYRWAKAKSDRLAKGVTA